MKPVIDTVHNKLVPALSLESSDACWLETLQGSVICRPFISIYQTLARSLAGAGKIGQLLQVLGFWLVPLLFFVLAARQFANDKEALALVVLAATALRLAGALLGGKERFSPSAVDGIVLAYFACNVIASFSSHYLKESLYGLAKLTVYVVSYFLFVSCLQQKPKQRTIYTLSALVAGALLVSLYGLWQYKTGVAPLATWEDPSIEDKTVRVFSTLGNPNLLAGYLIPIIPLSFALAAAALSSRSRRWWLGMPVWLTVGLPMLLVCGIIKITTLLTSSRGAWLALVAEGAVLLMVCSSWAWRAFPRARIPLIVGLLAVPVVAALTVHFVLPASYEHRIMSMFAGSEHSSNAYRLNVWKSSFAMFKDNWWLGIGTGNKTFTLAYGLYMRSGFDALGTYCVPLEVAVETGVLGLISFAWLFVACIARAHSRFWGTSDPVQRWLVVGTATAIVGMMAHGLVDTVFLRPQVQFIFWLCVAILVALPAAPGAEDPPAA